MAARPRVLVPVLVACLLASASGAGSAAPAPAKAPADTIGAARVIYLAGTSVYVDAGLGTGLAEGDTLDVLRDGRVVGRLRADYLSTRRASCGLVAGSAAVRPGDAVRYVRHPVAPSAADSAANAVSAREVAAPREHKMRGRMGLRYLASRAATAGAPSFSQPSLDLRFDARGLGNPGLLDLSVDARARRTFRSDSTHGENRTRVYRLSASLRDPAARTRVTAGRQSSGALSSVSLFDGVLIETGGPRFGGGLLAGTQPDPTTFGWSGAVRQFGAYGQVRRGAPADRRWTLTAGAISSYDHGQINRDFLCLDAQVLDRRWSAFLSQEFDVNRGWRAGGGATQVSPTSAFAIVRAQVNAALSLNAGYDRRKNVLLYRDRITPETEFDDRVRRGEWLGAGLDLPRGVRLGLDSRLNGGGVNGGPIATSHSLSVEIQNLRKLGIDVRSRTTRYQNDRTDGWLQSFSASARAGSMADFELSAGVRSDNDRLDPSLDTGASWTGIDADFHVARRLYLQLSAERDRGGAAGFDQQYVSLSYRF